MELGLAAKGVVVTGGSKGIAKAIALAFAKEGANLSICARGEADRTTIQEELRELGIEAYAEACDVSDKEALLRFLENSQRALGRIDVLVNNASGQVLDDDVLPDYVPTFMLVPPVETGKVERTTIRSSP